MAFTYEYSHLRVAVDFVVFGVDLSDPDPELLVLLVRADAPFEGYLALPGGFVRIDEDLDAAAKRELREETGIGRQFYMEQLRTFGALDRDPCERVITVAYLVLVNIAHYKVRAGSDAAAADWHSARPVASVLAFDHAEILKVATERLEAKVRYAPIGFDLLPKKFSLGELQRLYEVILDRPLDKRNFRRRIGEMGILTPAGERSTAGRSAQLYSFYKAAYDRAVQRGFHFEVQ